MTLLRAHDAETWLFAPGMTAPPIVCWSTAGDDSSELFPDVVGAVAAFRRDLENGCTIAAANAPYDLGVAAQADPTLLRLIFKALDEGRIHDVLIAEGLNAIYHGHFGQQPDGRDLISPSTGRVSKRYSLEIVTQLLTGRTDAKANDVWRKSYALLHGLPLSSWPETARVYPLDDVRNTLEDAKIQLAGHKNLQDLPAQVSAAFALHLGSAHAFRTDPAKVVALKADADAKHAVAVERYQKIGWIREDGSEDQSAVKRAVAEAYGVKAPCKRCGGSRKVRKTTWAECRGAKVKGRYKGCWGNGCAVCKGTLHVPKIGNEVTCKNEFDDDGKLVAKGCDGTGFDLDSVPVLPRTDKQGVSTDRDTLLEAGDEDLADYGANEFEKTRTTYVGYLAKGIDAPLPVQSNVLVASGRCSYEGCPVHQFPRSGGERGCIRARGEWCGYPEEMVLGSTDYAAGELCTLAQFTYWLFGESRMRDVINASGNPGILHSDLASEVLGISLDEFLRRYDAKEKQAVDFRQAMKPIGFGVPGGMGTAKLVYTSRKKNAGFTICERGPARMRDKKGVEHAGYWGVRFCVLTGGAKECGTVKITTWKDRPCPPICKACADVVENVLKPAYFRRYAEVRRYHRWAASMIDEGRPAPCLLFDARIGKPVVVRERGGAEFPAYCNNGFQAMLADIGKRAFYTMTKECYLGEKEDGSPSPLAGSRIPLFLHDEPLSELLLDRAHEAGPRIAEIMMETGRKFAPDVTWEAKTALAFWWSKSMEPEHHPISGQLIPWGPIPDEHKARFAS